jgi:hypothetical protein
VLLLVPEIATVPLPELVTAVVPLNASPALLDDEDPV